MWPFDPDETDPEALTVYESAVRELRHEPDGPQDERQWADLGRQLNRLASLRAGAGDAEGAIDAFDEAMAIWKRLGREKAHFVSSMRRSLVLARAGQADQALEAMNALIERAQIDPAYRPYYDTLALYRAAILAASGKKDRALEDLDRAIDVRRARKPGSEEDLLEWRDELLDRG